jgi:hypothetical protein
MPPPVTESRFQGLEGATKEQVEKRARTYVRELRSFLNRGSCLSDIQRIRRGWRPRSKVRLAFEGDKFPTDREHWYIYNTGGRNAACADTVDATLTPYKKRSEGSRERRRRTESYWCPYATGLSNLRRLD